ncbi:MAG: metallophosphoesterase [Desulfobulbus sp.]
MSSDDFFSVQQSPRITDELTCAIGDIHGCHVALMQLLAQVQHRAKTIVFLGDYIDRGPQSKEVIQTILDLRTVHPRVIPLMGNHEFMLLEYLRGRDPGIYLHAGGTYTLASYCLDPFAAPARAMAEIPREHLAFFDSLPLFWEDPYAIYVHAGLQPHRHLSQQTAQWCLWAREEFLRSNYNFGKPVVFGHTVFDEPYCTDTKIGIDTGAVYGGRLTALLLPTMEVISVPGRQSSL